ncbi:pyruvate dehydrogenase phosphatase regulatory subunit, mitochondrial isoform X1 [Halyomorpha halys]|uniref:pyruvate dehydrogenase phosphatase regulatory subunit, mitochondrial isoform X1 n=1 Tax=Halyomorpha halys TaxID=286706 RepID=UPI0006D4DD67|nr:pyruvate dehydrogenase phosphatase regulatory subunit, mitochondrial isoform X1 [Halyomorpha halys]XP_014279895.1 pyruvate dehydrogenase phosphatase regulatory subunit, mitochondrial isoform X1 [Halyomorpha halys]
MLFSALSKQRCQFSSTIRLFSLTSWTRSDFAELRTLSAEKGLPSSVDVVICGGGLVGASVAYHLAQMGWGPRTILLEQASLGGAPTWNTIGLVGVFKPTLAQVRLCQTSMEMIRDLEALGLPTGWKQCGSLCLARTSDRMTVFRRMKSLSISWNIDCELVTPIEAQRKCPLIAIDDLKGGLWIPGDGVGDPYTLCSSLLKLAVSKGLRVYENCSVSSVIAKNGRVDKVVTPYGGINCSAFVNTAGFWARELGARSLPPVKIPIHPVEHYHLLTVPMNIDPMMPVVRDLDGYIYFREYEGCIVAGGFEPVAKPAYENGKIPSTQAERSLPEDWDHFSVLLEQLLIRIPSVGETRPQKLSNLPEAFSPDCKWVVGEAPEVERYYIASGMKTVGISAAGGVGKAIAELITKNKTSYDMYEIDISRFLGLHNNTKFLRERVCEVPGLHYSLIYPFHEFQTGRKLRMSPIFTSLKDAGAVFGQVMGYERPSWFEHTGAISSSEQDNPSKNSLKKGERGNLKQDVYDGGTPYRIASTNTFSKPPWFNYVAAEYAACRETIGLSDYSSFTKLELWSKGDEVVKTLQYLCSNDVDVVDGSIIHTGMQNEMGGYENDCSLVRLAHNHYMMVAPTIQQTRSKVWIQRHLPKDGSVCLSDVTSMYTAICIMGPLTRSLLSELTEQDLRPKSFPFFTYKEIDVGLANGIRALNLTHTGELGYVLYIPNEFALHVYQKLIETGEKYGLKHCGYYAMRALRVEKFYAFWGQDLDTTTTPLECGRTWRVKFDKGEFIGRSALLKQQEEGVNRMYVQLLLEDHDEETDIWPWGGEPIYRNGKYVGATTTTGYGFTFKQQVCLGFIMNLDEKGNKQKVTSDYVLSGDYEVDVGGRLYSAKVNLHSPNLPTKYPDQERQAYSATRNKMIYEPILRAVP